LLETGTQCIIPRMDAINIKALILSFLFGIYSSIVAMSYLLLLKKVTSDIAQMTLILLFLVIVVFVPIIAFVIVILPGVGMPARFIDVTLWALLWGSTSIFVRIKRLKR
jgi:hypothetical protein